MEHQDKPNVQKTLSSVRALLTSKGSIAMLEPHVPNINQYINSSDLEKRRSIFKTFNFYIPFLQLFRLSKNHKSYSQLPIYQKLESFVFAPELTKSIIEIVQRIDNER